VAARSVERHDGRWRSELRARRSGGEGGARPGRSTSGFAPGLGLFGELHVQLFCSAESISKKPVRS